MEVAKVIDGQVLAVGHYRDVSDLMQVPTDEQLSDRNLYRVNLFRPHDQATQILEPCAPVFESPWVYTMAVRNLTAEEIAVRAEIAAMKAAQEQAQQEATNVDQTNPQ
jgi:tryptophan 2,3-dioxygenase